MAGTEVIIESTANGMDALFYAMCMDAVQGRSEYQLIFIPWFWQSEYRKTPPEHFIPTSEEAKLAELYKLDWAQIYWRRMKISEIKEIGFKQEYPCNIEEAFTTSGTSLIDSNMIMTARKLELEDISAPLVLGVDPAPRGISGFALRRGREVLKTWNVVTVGDPQGEMRLAGMVASILDSHPVVKCFTDLGNGYGVHDRLLEMGYGDVVTGVHFAEGAIEEKQYLNKRAEMWHVLKDYIEGGGVRLPDSDNLHKQLTCVPAAKKTSSGLTKLEAKEKIIADTGIDPHEGDALALTFAYPVRNPNVSHHSSSKVARKGRSPLKSSRDRQTPNESNIASTTMRWI